MVWVVCVNVGRWEKRRDAHNGGKRELICLHLGACDGRLIEPDDGGDDALERVSHWDCELFSGLR
jgi:hypothetical protein